MEALLPTSSTAYLPLNTSKMMLANGVRVINYNQLIPSSSSLPVSGRRRSLSVIVGARNKDKKENTHSFIPKPDEATGFFPQAVLLKPDKVQEDGTVHPDFADDKERRVYESLMLELESDLDVERMRHYEVVYLIHEKHEEEVAAVNEKIQNFLGEKKGRLWRFNDWGMRQLAYKIQKANRAHYLLMNFEVDAKYINEFKSMLDKDERVIRHLVIKRDKAITEDRPPPPEYDTLQYEDDDDDDEIDVEYDDEGEEEGEIDAEYDDEGDYDDDDDEEEEEGEIDAEYDDEGDYDDDLDGEEEMEDDDGDNIIYIDGDEDEEVDGDRSESKDDRLTYVSQAERRRLRAEKVSK